MDDYELMQVPVRGGELTVARWGSGPLTVVAVHGISASHRAWSAVAEHLDGITLVAPDLRGRGASEDAPGPFGMPSHARDILEVIDRTKNQHVVMAGHSMGGYVVLELAAMAPERVSSIVLVDGGLAAPLPPGADVDRLLEAALGPALARLRRSFESRDAYFSFWKEHPAFKETGCWNEHVDAYLDYDLTGKPPELRSRVSEQAVIEDGREVLSGTKAWENLGAISCPVSLLRAPRGLLNQREPLIADPLVEQARRKLSTFRDEVVLDCNHYTLMFEKHAAATVARAIQQGAGA
ncbi:MAG: alpha/beta hydrolase [Actinomycetota bacterium]|nr:alpha/beta hydrolase [Actinomycetota bacterium]